LLDVERERHVEGYGAQGEKKWWAEKNWIFEKSKKILSLRKGWGKKSAGTSRYTYA